MTLTELKEKKQAYVAQKVDEIINYMTTNEKTMYKMSTCGNHSNWDKELHNAMPDISREAISRGLTVTYEVNWGVSDWTFKV